VKIQVEPDSSVNFQSLRKFELRLNSNFLRLKRILERKYFFGSFPALLGARKTLGSRPNLSAWDVHPDGSRLNESGAWRLRSLIFAILTFSSFFRSSPFFGFKKQHFWNVDFAASPQRFPAPRTGQKTPKIPLLHHARGNGSLVQ